MFCLLTYFPLILSSLTEELSMTIVILMRSCAQPRFYTLSGIPSNAIGEAFALAYNFTQIICTLLNCFFTYLFIRRIH